MIVDQVAILQKESSESKLSHASPFATQETERMRFAVVFIVVLLVVLLADPGSSRNMKSSRSKGYGISGSKSKSPSKYSKKKYSLFLSSKWSNKGRVKKNKSRISILIHHKGKINKNRKNKRNSFTLALRNAISYVKERLAQPPPFQMYAGGSAEYEQGDPEEHGRFLG
ncbi:unnamed protein product [Arctogadus glacialis]